MTLAEFPGNTPESFSVLAFDYGTQRIGVAHGQNVTGTAQPLETLPARDGIPDWERLAKLIEKWQPHYLLVGVPFNMDGSRSPLCDRAEKFARRLEGRYQISCYGIDERLSSVAAEELRNPENKNASLDSLAAQIILETWFSEFKARPTGKQD